MRSRREEYTQRFEELTKQEIKNYNDSLVNTHIALEEFRRKLRDSVDLYASQVAHLSSTIKKVESENRDLKIEIASLSKKLESQVHDLNNLDRKSIEEDRDRAKWEKSLLEEFYRLQDFMHFQRDINTNETLALKHAVNNIATNALVLNNNS